MTIYSHSKLNTFEQCPMKFKFQYIDRTKTDIEQSIEAFLGSRVHEALEKIYKDLKFEKLNTMQEILDFYNKSWQNNWNDNIVIVKKEYTLENYRKMGEKFITDYYNRYQPFDDSKTIGLETEYKVYLDSEKKHQIHVRIDRLAIKDDNTYEIHDYKTSNSLPTQEKVDSDRQLAIYAYGIKQMYPDAKKIRLIWHYLAFDKEMVSERTDEQINDLKLDILDLIKDIEKCEEFPTNESALCNWCQYMPICPRFKHKLSLEKKEINEFKNDDGVSLANKYAAIYDIVKHNEKMLERLKEALSEYAQKNNLEVIEGSSVKVSIKNYPKLSFPKKGDVLQHEFISKIKELGLWEKFLTVDVYELAKSINSNKISDDNKKELSRFIKKGKTTYVRLSKKS